MTSKTVPREPTDSDAEHLLTMFGNCINDYFNAKIAEYNAAVDAAPADSPADDLCTRLNGAANREQADEYGMWLATLLREAAARIAALGAELAQLRQAIGLATTLHPTLEMDARHPLQMMQRIHEYVLDQIRRWTDEARQYAQNAEFQRARAEAAEARCAELEQDAARYRFLRDTPVYDTGIAVADVPDARDDVEFLYDAQLDSAVDRARAKYKRDKENAGTRPASSDVDRNATD